MTKKVKRTISVIIAAIMLLSTMSVLALATDLPTYPEATSKEVGPHDHVAAVASKAVVNANGFVVCAKGEPLYVEDKAAYAQPTCVKPGCQEFYVICSVCGKEMPNTRVKYEIPVLKSHHQPGPVVIEDVKNPTCRADGSYYEVVRCVLCNEELSRTLVAVKKTTAHVPDLPVKENIVDSTCAKVGTYDSVIRCKVCGTVLSLVRKEIPKKEYHVSEYSLTRYVRNLGNGKVSIQFYKEQPIDAPAGQLLNRYVLNYDANGDVVSSNPLTLDTSDSAVIVDPAQAVAGNYLYPYVDSDVSGLYADPNGAIVVRRADGTWFRATRIYELLTETDSGVATGFFRAGRYAANRVPGLNKTRTCADGEERCAICGELLNPQIPHTWDAGVVTRPATLTNQGEITYSCLIKGCTATYTVNTAVKAAGKGDVDGDGSVTTADARYILRYAVNLGSYDKVINSSNLKAADMDGNNEIETADARLALRTAVGLRNP